MGNSHLDGLNTPRLLDERLPVVFCHQATKESLLSTRILHLICQDECQRHWKGGPGYNYNETEAQSTA